MEWDHLTPRDDFRRNFFFHFKKFFLLKSVPASRNNHWKNIFWLDAGKKILGKYLQTRMVVKEEEGL